MLKSHLFVKKCSLYEKAYSVFSIRNLAVWILINKQKITIYRTGNKSQTIYGDFRLYSSRFHTGVPAMQHGFSFCGS